MRLWRLVCVMSPLRASISRTAAWAVDAPVAMLRVYCSWPGVSATIKRRFGRGEIAIRDVDGDALLALGLQPVHQQREVETLALGAEFFGIRLQRLQLILEDEFCVVKQAADQRRLAIVDAAAGDEAQRIHQK